MARYTHIEGEEYSFLAKVEMVGVTSRRLTLFVDDEIRRTFPNLSPTFIISKYESKPRPLDVYGKDIRLLASGSIMGNKLVPDHIREEVESYNGRRFFVEKLEQLLSLDSHLWFLLQSFKRWEYAR